jgi:hypothetical protein
MVASLLRLAGLDWPVPDFSTLCRRQNALAVQVPYGRADRQLSLPVDGTGLGFLGGEAEPRRQGRRASPANEWQARKHGSQRRRRAVSPNSTSASPS